MKMIIKRKEARGTKYEDKLKKFYENTLKEIKLQN